MVCNNYSINNQFWFYKIIFFNNIINFEKEERYNIASTLGSSQCLFDLEKDYVLPINNYMNYIHNAIIKEINQKRKYFYLQEKHLVFLQKIEHKQLILQLNQQKNIIFLLYNLYVLHMIQF